MITLLVRARAQARGFGSDTVVKNTFGKALRLAVLISTLVAYSSGAIGQGPTEQPASSIDAPRVRIGVLHTPLSSSEIPPVGSIMKLQVSLANTIDIETKVRLVGSKDGRFIDIAFPTGALNNADQPTFVAEIPSPAAAMTYQFIVHQKDGTLTSSRKFIVRRPCIQNFTVSVPTDPNTTQFRREVASLVAQANNLERDNKSLDASLKLLEEMKTSMSR